VPAHRVMECMGGLAGRGKQRSSQRWWAWSSGLRLGKVDRMIGMMIRALGGATWWSNFGGGEAAGNLVSPRAIGTGTCLSGVRDAIYMYLYTGAGEAARNAP
jgi:hypothetical protein